MENGERERQNELKRRLKMLHEERIKRRNEDNIELSNKNAQSISKANSRVLSHSEWKKKEEERLNKEKEDLIREIEEKKRIELQRIEDEKEKERRRRREEERLEKEKFLREVDLMIIQLMKNERINNLISNFFSKFTTENIFLNERELLYIETGLYRNYHLKNEMLLGNRIYLNEEYNGYKDENFNMLLEVVKRYTNYNNNEVYELSMWKILNKFAIQHFSKTWSELYGVYFSDISKLSIENCIDIYCKIDLMDIHSQSSKLLFTYYLMNNGKFDDIVSDSSNRLLCYERFNEDFAIREKEIQKQNGLNNFEKILDDTGSSKIHSIYETDIMTGIEFERFIERLFQRLGYYTMVTKASGDQGIDIIITKNNHKIGVQAKCYSNKVSNSAIQEAVSGKNYYKCNKVMVVTNNFFTKSAIELANVNDVTLWDRETLKEKIVEVY